ncbi:MAG: hypothetical protein RIG84_16745 [Roseovarius sp.]
MRARNRILLAIGATLAVLGAGAAALQDRVTRLEARIDALEPTGAGPLDGQTYVGMLGPVGAPKDVPDRFIFAAGTFLSTECRESCDYPARPYEVTEIEGGYSFTSTTRCPYKDSTIVWNGTAVDGKVSGVVTWTMRRWYWTIERDFEFEGVLQDSADTAASAT